MARSERDRSFAQKLVDGPLAKLMLYTAATCLYGKRLVQSGGPEYLSPEWEGLPLDTQKLVYQVLEALTRFAAGINGLDASVARDLVGYCVAAVCDPNALRNTTIQMGFGGSTKTSLRSVVYLIPAAEFLRRLKALGLPCPDVRVFTAQMCAVRTNGYSPNELWPVTATTFAACRDFLRTFYPDVAGSFSFDFDFPVNEGIEASAMRIATGVDRAALNGLGSVVRKLNEFASRRRASASLYGAFHALYFLDLHTPSISPTSAWVRHRRDDLQHRYLISMGAPPERWFGAVRKEVVGDAGGIFPEEQVVLPRHSLKLVLATCEAPPYFNMGTEPSFAMHELQGIDLRALKLVDGGRYGRDFSIIEGRVQAKPFMEWAHKIAGLVETAGRADEILAGNMLLNPDADLQELLAAACECRDVETEKLSLRESLLSGAALRLQ